MNILKKKKQIEFKKFFICFKNKNFLVLNKKNVYFFFDVTLLLFQKLILFFLICIKKYKKEKINKIKVKFYNKFLKEKIKVGDKYYNGKVRLVNILIFFYGISFFCANKICFIFGLSENITLTEIKNLNENLFDEIFEFISNTFYFGRVLLRQQVELMELRENIGLWHGIRFFKGLPVNGQRTHSNSSTQKKVLIKFLQIANEVKGKKE